MMVTDVQFGAGLQMFSNSNGFVINAPFDVPTYQWTMKKQAEFTYITNLNLGMGAKKKPVFLMVFCQTPLGPLPTPPVWSFYGKKNYPYFFFRK